MLSKPGKPRSPIASPRASQLRRNVDSMRLLAQRTSQCVLLTNDDGIDSRMTLDLAKSLGDTLGCRIVIVAPADNKSAASMALSLRKEMELHRRPEAGADAFSLSGSPADCVMAALDPADGLLAAMDLRPMLVVSGPNYGPNLSTDVLHSGTVGAARMAAMLGVPAIASSSFLMDRQQSDAGVISATVEVVAAALQLLDYQPATNWPRDFNTQHSEGSTHVRRHVIGSAAYASHEHGGDVAPEEALREAFAAGDLVLNINAPLNWDVEARPMATTGLGLMYYYNQFETTWVHNPLSTTADLPTSAPPTITHHPDTREVSSVLRTQPDAAPPSTSTATTPPPTTVAPNSVSPGTLVAVYTNKYSTRGLVQVEGSDIWANQKGAASVTSLQTWPEGHPLCLKDALMSAALKEAPGGLPAWLVADGASSSTAAAAQAALRAASS